MLERAMPLVEQVRQRLLRGIRDDSLVADNGALPSEAEIAERLAVSRATVRDALARLERDHVIIRRHGAGTYVNPTVRGLTATLDVLRDPATLIEMTDQAASVVAFTTRLARIRARHAQALELPASKLVVEVSVAYLANSRPAVWLDATIPVGDPPPSLPPHYSTLPEFVNELTGQITTHSLATLEAAEADARLAQHLNLRPGQAMIRLIDVYLDAVGTPAFYSESCFAPGVIPLQLLRKTDGGPRRGRVSIW